jgi:hypothetical protein
MAGYLFNHGALLLQNGTINWETASIRARLSQTTETPDRNSTVMTGLGLAVTDLVVTSRVGPVEDDINNRIAYQSDPLSFPAVAEGPQVDKAVVFAFGTSDTDSIPIAVVTITNPVMPNRGGILIDIDPAGMFYTQQ